MAPSIAWSLVALGLVRRISPKQANQTHNHQKPWWTLCIPCGFAFVLCRMNVLLVKVKRGCAPISHCAVHSTEGKLKIRGSFQTCSKCNHQVWMHCIRWSWMYLNKGYFTEVEGSVCASRCPQAYLEKVSLLLPRASVLSDSTHHSRQTT